MLTRRVFADTVGFLAFTALMGAAGLIFFGPSTAIRHWSTVSAIILALAIASYPFWVWLDWKGADHAQGALATVWVGFAFLLIDFVGGRLFRPDLGLIESAISSPLFVLTLFMCPFCTIVLLCGWLRSAILVARAS